MSERTITPGPVQNFNLNQEVAKAMSSTFSPVEPESSTVQYVDPNLPERNALGAIIMNNALATSYQAWQQGERGPYGLLRVKFVNEKIAYATVLPSLPSFSRYKSSSYTEYTGDIVNMAAFCIGGTLVHDIRAECDRLVHLPPDNPERRRYDRLKQLTDGYSDNGDRPMFDDPVYQFTERAGTAVSVLKKTASILSELYRHQHTVPPKLSQLGLMLRNSYPTVATFANGSKNVNLPAMHAMETMMGTFDEMNFNLVETENGPALGVIGWPMIKHHHQKALTEALTIQGKDKVKSTGCPALAASHIIQDEDPGFKNVVKGTFDWLAATLEKIDSSVRPR